MIHSKKEGLPYNKNFYLKFVIKVKEPSFFPIIKVFFFLSLFQSKKSDLVLQFNVETKKTLIESFHKLIKPKQFKRI